MDCCGSCCLAMSTVSPTPGVGQTSNGGAEGLSNLFNTVGKWGVVLTSTLQNKPVVATQSGVTVGLKSQPLANALSSPMIPLFIIGAIAVVVIVFAMTGKK